MAKLTVPDGVIVHRLEQEPVTVPILQGEALGERIDRRFPGVLTGPVVVGVDRNCNLPWRYRIE